MHPLVLILLFTFVGSIAALIGGIALLANKSIALRLSHPLTSFAAGTLLGTAFFDLLPEALEKENQATNEIFFWTLIGLLAFFLIERLIHWTHHHDEDEQDLTEKKATIPLIIIGDTLHNFIDGIAIGATTLANPSLGLITTIAVAAHEIPQEIGDFGLMLHKGVSRKKVIFFNMLSAMAAFIGALLAYTFGDIFQTYIPSVLAITSGFFIYIATSDIIPEMHKEQRRKFALAESGLLMLGIVFVYFSTQFLPE